MPYYLLLSRSITHAQRMSYDLSAVGIVNRIIRPPVGLTDKGCAYAVKVSAHAIGAALDRLQERNLMPVRVFYAADDGAYREIRPR